MPRHRQVSYGEVVFDTFDGGSTPLPEASPELIERLRDAIRPINDPKCGSPDGLPWLTAEHLVLRYEAGCESFAYPFNVLNLRELVNDTIGGTPVLISYCPLCGCAAVYDRRLGGRELLCHCGAPFGSPLLRKTGGRPLSPVEPSVAQHADLTTGPASEPRSCR